MRHSADLSLAPIARAQLLREVALAYPLEACGALLGSGGRVVGVHPLPNRAPDPGNSFTIDPVELEPLLRREADGGLPVLGFYHSHPDSEPVPSTRDLAVAWSGYWYVIVAVHRGATGPTCAWRVDRVPAGPVGLHG